jgi:hypothetical protein
VTVVVRDEAFDRDVDETWPVEVEGVRVRVSDALARDAEGYSEARRRWRSRKDDDTQKVVLATYPHPIAVRFKRARQDMEWSQSLGRLQDAWEAIITVTAALAICEARELGLDCSHVAIRSRDIAFHSIFDAIVLIENMLSRHRERLTVFASLRDGSAIVENMKTLNVVRRDLAHGGTPSELEAQAAFEELEPLVFSLLEELASLGEITLLSPVDTERAHRFSGTSPDLETTPRDYSDAQRRVLFGRSGRAGRRDVFAVHQDGAFCLSPLIRWEEAEDGHFRLLYLDEMKEAGFKYRSYTSTLVYDSADPVSAARCARLRSDEQVLRADFFELRKLVEGRPTERLAKTTKARRARRA